MKRKNVCASISNDKVGVSLIMLSLDALYLIEYESTSVCASVYPTNATNSALKWSFSNEKVAIVDDNGNVFAAGRGIATITATATDGSGISESCTVAVCKRYTYVYSIALCATELVLEKGQSYELSVEEDPADASCTQLVWHSHDVAVASVCNGVVTAHNSGKTEITVSTTDGSFCCASCTVIVTEGDSV